ncbi:hypothetical protein [Micromonospora echinofusca]|uniref:NADPH-dependent FMN reductase n=1 Tax=Micromonospora echinofusca TaxID=47858 RepID=A0A1C5GF86_MICEH|nr:hypothetical protein [Micromonospora echinofusca]SCG18460.1 hypothetical protein GA0070610_4803 [Micromonospora echinofusca]
MPCLTVIVASTRPGRAGRRIGDWFTAATAYDASDELVPDPERDAAATVLLDEVARLAAALTPLRVTA